MVSFAPFCFPASVCPLNVLMIMMGAVIYVLSEMSAVLHAAVLQVQSRVSGSGRR